MSEKDRYSRPNSSSNPPSGVSNHDMNAFAPWFRRQFEYVRTHPTISPYLAEPTRNGQPAQRGSSFNSVDNSDSINESMASDETSEAPPPPPPMFQPYSPPQPRRLFASNKSAVSTESEQKVSIWTCYKGNPKRRMDLLTILALLVFGPPVFLAGYYAGRGMDVVQEAAYSNSGASVSSSNDGQGSTTPSTVLLMENQMIQSEESFYLGTNEEGIHLKQESNGNLVLYSDVDQVLWSSEISTRSAIWKSSGSTSYYSKLQDDGNLVTRSRTIGANGGASSRIIWSSSSSSGDGKYVLRLNAAGDGLEIVRDTDGEMVWTTSPQTSKTQSPVSVPAVPTAPPTAFPTRQPTPPTQPPTGPPSRSPTPRPTASPTPKPTTFPRPPTVNWSTTETLKSGPMLGHTTHFSAKIWAVQGAGKTMELDVWANGDDPSTAITMSMSPNQINGASMVTVDYLAPKTLYLYELRIENERVGEGHFTTAPAPNQPAKFSYLLASCMNIWENYPDQPVWDVALSKQPDFAMLAGDTVYLNGKDWTSQGEILLDRVWYRNLEQRAESHFANLLSSVPTYGTWDDHEYGMNNADHDQPGKENSLLAWKGLWPNPSHGLPDVTGNFYTYMWGDVHFIVMDNRWYRNNPKGTQFGAAQKEWLYQQLINSQSTFKVIVTGSDVMEIGMSSDLDDIGKIITQNSISGVLFNAGDIHRNEFKTQYNSYWPYQVTQITSSGVARNWRRNFAMIQVDTAQQDPSIVAQFYGAVDSNLQTTWTNNPFEQCSSIGGDRNKQSTCTETIRLSQLTA